MTYTTQRWHLDDLLPVPGSPEQLEHMEKVEANLQAFEAFRDRLSPEIPTSEFQEILKSYEALYEDLARLGAYSYLWFSEDTGDQDALAFKSRVEQFVADVENRTLFFSLWWKSLDDAAAARLMAVSGDVQYFLESLRRFKPHTLTEPEERVVNIKDVNGMSAVLTIYDMLTTRFTYRFTVEGEEKTLTRGALMTYVYSPDPALREAAYKELYRLYGENSDVLAQIYAARVRDWHAENVKLRSFSSPISVRNLDNDIPDTVVETLLDVARKNVGLFQRYFRNMLEEGIYIAPSAFEVGFISTAHTEDLVDQTVAAAARALARATA